MPESSENDDVWDTTALKASSAAEGSPIAEAVALRSDILRMTQTAENAVLRPADPGRWSHGLRAALAARIARLNDCPQLADQYLALPGADAFSEVANPASADAPDDLKMSLAFVDRVATDPANIAEGDIRVLQDAGIADADIVRLSELNAFLAYQIRLVAGLSLIAEART